MSNLDLKLAQHFLQEEPNGAARRLETQDPKVAAELLKTLPSDSGVKVLRAIHPRFSAEMLETLSDIDVARWLEKMNLADIAAIFRHATDSEFSRLLELLPVRKQTLCRLLVSYPDYTVGAWVDTDVLVLDHKMKVEDAHVRMKKRAYAPLSHIYVVNQQRQVVGQLPIIDLMRKSSGQHIEEIMEQQVRTINGYTELFGALKSSVWMQQDIVAVVNRNQEFIGALQHYRVRSALRRTEAMQASPTESSDLLDAYLSSFASLMDVFAPTGSRGE